jgi:uncharacterized protein (DUF433 family)
MQTENVVKAFGEDHVTRLTGLSKGQLRAWDSAGFFSPRYAPEDRRQAFSRVYSFRDVVALRTIAVLMHEHGVSLRELRRVAKELGRRGFSDWATLKLYVVNRQVHFRSPGGPDVEGVWDGQLAMVPIVDVMADVETRVQNLFDRTREQRGKVEKHKFVVRNAAVVAGTRIPTAAIRRYHKAGYSVADILREYPSLTRADVSAAIAYENRNKKSA